MHARIIQNVKLKEERDQLKRKIIELRNELLKVKEKTWKKQQVEELREKVKKQDLLLQTSETKSKHVLMELAALKEENHHIQAKLVQTIEELKIEAGFKNEFKQALENSEHFMNLRDSVAQITGMLISKSSKELTA
jgi:diaminopimelate epimerase